MLESVGKLQHLFDPRQFSDRLSISYEDGSLRVDPRDLWYVELLMVFALGELLRGTLKNKASLPGKVYFCEARQRVPDFLALRSSGVLGVEIMGLLAFYSQCADRRDDAYVYAGVALRLAISSGMARAKTFGPMIRSEQAHRDRVWWTIYMQERYAHTRAFA